MAVVTIPFNPSRLSLAGKFSLASLAVLVATSLAVGAWVTREIEAGVVHRAAAAAALYVENLVVAQLQEYGRGGNLSADRVRALERVLTATPLGREVVSVKIWGPGGRILYGTDAGRVFPVKPALARAWHGEVSSRITALDDDENADLGTRFPRLLETYTPLREEGTERVIAVAEFYQTVDALDGELRGARARAWLVVAAATLVTYLSLAGLVRRGSDTIARQQAELAERVRRLDALLTQNHELHARVRRAARRTTELNERVLGRVSAELHDGPAQDLSLALLRLDAAAERAGLADDASDLEAVRGSLRAALEEMRAIAAGLRVPELEALPLEGVVDRAVRGHRRRTGTDVAVHTASLPDAVPLPVKIAVFRIVQEALSNAFTHAGGVEQRVRLTGDAASLHLEVSDGGPGFDAVAARDAGRLGLAGMRERVESLGGEFELHTGPGGTTVRATLPLRAEVPDE